MEAVAAAAAVSGKPGYLPVIVWNTEGLSKTTLSQPEKNLVQHPIYNYRFRMSDLGNYSS